MASTELQVALPRGIEKHFQSFLYCNFKDHQQLKEMTPVSKQQQDSLN